MIPRYSRKKMANIWEPLNKFNIWLDIECHACDKMADLGIIPKSAASNIRKKAKFDLDRISELEKKTNTIIDNIKEAFLHTLVCKFIVNKIQSCRQEVSIRLFIIGCKNRASIIIIN